MDEKILTVQQPSNAADTMAMMMNNPWMYLVMMAWLGNGNLGNRGNANGVLDMETQNKLNSLQAQINDNNNNAWAREAITSVGARSEFAISQLSQNLGVGVAELRNAIAGIGAGIAQLGAQNGMGFAGVTNAINLGNLNLIQQLKDCCCGTQKQIMEQGYQGRIETINQTNDLQTSQRVESGLVRAEIASFRQAFEQSRYQDMSQKAERLQVELDILKSAQTTTATMNAAIAPLQAMVQQLYAQTFGATKPVSATQAAG